jgi:hypothetical protein
VPGTTYRPLDREAPRGQKSEIEKFRQAAKESTPREELIGLTALDAGMRGSGIAHLTESWLNLTGELTIEPPFSQKCRLGSENKGKGGDTTDQGKPCYDCEQRSMDRSWLPKESTLPDDGDCWVPKTEAGYKGRVIPILNDDTARSLVTYFKVHDTVVTRDAVNKAIKRIAKRAGIFEEDGGTGDRDWPTTHALRDTYGTRLAEMEFSRDEIKVTMGHETIKPADDYVSMSGTHIKSAFDEKFERE